MLLFLFDIGEKKNFYIKTITAVWLLKTWKMQVHLKNLNIVNKLQKKKFLRCTCSAQVYETFLRCFTCAVLKKKEYSENLSFNSP